MKSAITTDKPPNLQPPSNALFPDDAHTTVADLREICRQFVAARDWAVYHSPKNLAMSIAIEAAEIMEHVQWLTGEESRALVADADARAALADELADVVIYCLMLANSAQIDVSQAVAAKFARNQHRFPADVVRGRLG